jgi:hypothetical protein
MKKEEEKKKKAKKTKTTLKDYEIKIEQIQGLLDEFREAPDENANEARAQRVWFNLQQN